MITVDADGHVVEPRDVCAWFHAVDTLQRKVLGANALRFYGLEAGRRMAAALA